MPSRSPFAARPGGARSRRSSRLRSSSGDVAPSSRRPRARPRRRCRSGRRRRPRLTMTVPASTRSGTSRAARCSSDPPGSGAKIGTDARIRSSSVVGCRGGCVDAARRSRRSSDDEGGKERRRRRSARSRPRASAMSTGASAAPIPIDASQSIWMTPKTRARTSSGTARWTSVNAGDVDERVADRR